MASFTEKLSQEALDYFNKVSHSPFSQQAVAFLNAYWPEVHEEAEFIFGYPFNFLFISTGCDDIIRNALAEKLTC